MYSNNSTLDVSIIMSTIRNWTFFLKKMLVILLIIMYISDTENYGMCVLTSSYFSEYCCCLFVYYIILRSAVSNVYYEFLFHLFVWVSSFVFFIYLMDCCMVCGFIHPFHSLILNMVRLLSVLWMWVFVRVWMYLCMDL